jgi:hypothetical protein
MDHRQVVMAMVFGVISSELEVMSPHIFETGLRVNTDIYLEVIMESTVLPWIKTVAGYRPWVWQQDSAPTMTPTGLSRTDGIPAVLILNRWTILFRATWRYILTDPSLPRTL